eukprot:g5192.t2
MEERGLRRTSSAPTATRRARIGHRLLLKMGLRKRGFCPLFDTAHRNYTWLKHYVEEMRESLSAYALQLARMTEAARGLGEDASHLYSIQDKGFKPVWAFREAQDKGHNGYAGQLQQAFVKGVIEPVGEWHRDLESLEKLVTDFDEIRIQHDHYRLKVEDLAQKAKSLEARATTRGDSRDAKHAAEKLKRNTVKLNEVTAEFDKRLGSCCDKMTNAWNEREKMMNGIVARIIHFQESFFAEQLMSGLGVSRILSEAEGRGPRWGGTAGIEPFVPKGHVRHYEGELLRKHVLIKERMWYRLVGSSLEVYDVKSKDDEPLYVVTEAPIAVHEVKGVTKITPVNFRVAILSGDGGLNLFAADEADGKGWMDALTRASEWDQLTSTRTVEGYVRESRAFLGRCKKAHRDTTTSEGLEREFGVTKALANPPPPPADRPDVKSYTAARTAGGGSASAASGGGGGKEASGSGGGSVAAGIAPGGEAGVAAAAGLSAAAAAAAKWKGGKGKKGNDGDENIPELVKAGEKKGGKGGGGRGPEIGIGGLFPGRTGRGSVGAGPGVVPLGMMGGRSMPPSQFSGAASSFGGSAHSSINGFGGGGSQMGDPRLHMSQPSMGMAPPVNPSTGLPPGMTQNGPPLVLPLGMVPPGGGPPVMNQPPAPSVMDQSMMGGMGGRGPGSGWIGGGPQPGRGWGGGGLQQTRSFGGRFGPAPGARQQGFRRSSSFNDMNMGGPFDDGVYPPGFRGRRLSPMMEDDGFDTQSTRSAPVFGATAAVGEAAAAAEAASAEAARVAAGGHVADTKKSSGTEESKSSSKKEGGGASAQAVGAAAAAAAIAAAAAAPSPAPSPPLPPSEPAHGPVTIQTIHPNKEAAVSAASVTAVEQTNTAATTTTTSASTTSNSTTVTHVEVPAASSAAAASTADASSARAAVTTVTTAAATTAAEPAAAPTSPLYLSDRGDDGGLSRYGTTGETPARVRRKPVPTWKRMMSLGSTASSRSYRYDGGDMGVSGEAKPSAEEMFEGDRSKDTSSLKKTKSDRWNLRRAKSSVTDVSPPRGSLAPSSSSTAAAASSTRPRASSKSRAAATAVAERKTSSSSTERRASSTGRGSRSARAGRSRPIAAGTGAGVVAAAAAAGGAASAAAAAKLPKGTKGTKGVKGAKAISPSEDVAFDDEEYKRAPPITRDETSIGRATRFTTRGGRKKPSASSASASASTKSKAKDAAKAGAAAATAATAAVATSVGVAATTPAATATAREKSAAAVEKAGARSASAGVSAPSPAVAGGTSATGQVEAPSATVGTASDTSAAPSGVFVAVGAPSPIIAPGSASSSVISGPSTTPVDTVFAAVSSAPASAVKITTSGGSAVEVPAAADTESTPVVAAAETKTGSAADDAAVDKVRSAAAALDAKINSTAAAADTKFGSTTVAAAVKAKEDAAAKYAEERKASAEAAKRVDNSTGIMKNLTLEEIMARSSSSDAVDTTGGVGVNVDGTGGSGGGKSFDLTVPAVAAAAGGAVAAAATAVTATGGGDSAALSSADGLKTAAAGSVDVAAVSNRATVGDATLIVPATKPARREAAGCEAITPAHFQALNAATTPASPEPAAATPRTAAKSAATAAAEASSVAEAAASAASAAAAAAAAAAASSSPQIRSAGGVTGGGGSAASPPRASAAAGAAAAPTVAPALSPDTPGSTGSAAQVAAQAKVFQRLCDTSGSEAETGDAGGGGGGAASPHGESVLSYQQLMGWDEVQELLDYGALKEEELTSLWQEAVRVQEVERGAPDPLAKSTDIWGSSASGSGKTVAPADGSDGGGGTNEALTQRGFMILVKLIEELQFEKELEQDKGVSLLVALAVVIGTTAVIGDMSESEARDSLENQITRHLTDASVEAAATIGERFRKIQYGVLDVTAFALRDTMQEGFDLDGGGQGYPLTPAHTDLRDTEIAASPEAYLEDFGRQSFPVDLSRSVWYSADASDFTVEITEEDELQKIARTARLDLLWPTMYLNSNDTKAILVGAELSTSNQILRYFPGSDLSGQSGSRFACEFEEEDGSTPCYDVTVRNWYEIAEDADQEPDINLGEAVIYGPYNDGINKDWLVTLARAVYSDSGPTAGDLLGVAGVDVRLEQVQLTVEGINFLDNTGYSILATAEDGTVLAAGAGVWDRDTEDETTTVCALGIGICSGEEGWANLLEDTNQGGIRIFTSTATAGSEEESILIATPVETTFQTNEAGGAGTPTLYILSIVPRDKIIISTAIVACCTLVAVAAAVYLLSGSITRPIVKMTKAARSIAKDGAKHDVFGSVSVTWGGRNDGGGGGGGSLDSRTAGRYTIGRTRCLDYLLCRGDDEISTLAREFSSMITGLGRRGAVSEAKTLGEGSGFPKNPFTAAFVRPPPAVPSAPRATSS